MSDINDMCEKDKMVKIGNKYGIMLGQTIQNVAEKYKDNEMNETECKDCLENFFQTAQTNLFPVLKEDLKDFNVEKDKIEAITTHINTLMKSGTILSSIDKMRKIIDERPEIQSEEEFICELIKNMNSFLSDIK